jgi:hypothetical protein
LLHRAGTSYEAAAQQETRMADALPEGGPRSRFWLFAPFVVLLLVAVAWSAAWVFFRQRAAEGLDAFLARQARAGRQWTCADRGIGGYPFRIEVSCGTLTVQRGDATASFGRVLSVAQVYQPQLIIAEVAGPLQASDGGARIDARWRLLQVSLHLTPGGFQRASLVVDGPEVRATGIAPDEVAGRARRLEAHLRPDPARFEQDGAYDVAATAAGAAVPFLDDLIGSADPLEVALDATATRARGFSDAPAVTQLERWRQAGGTLEVKRLGLTKGPRRVEAKGLLALDDLHRPAGRVELAAAGIEELIARVTGVRVEGNGAAALIGALMGQPPPDPKRFPGDPKLTQLPPLKLDRGRVLLGPFPLPVRLAPLY